MQGVICCENLWARVKMTGPETNRSTAMCSCVKKNSST